MTGNTVYLVTGGNRGLGLGLVRSFLARSLTTVIASVRSAEAAATLKAEKITLGENSVLHVILLDFSTAIAPEKIRQIFDAEVGSSVDHIDVLINNAGVCNNLNPALEVTADDLRMSFEVNTIGPLLVFQAFWPLLQKSASNPKLINVTSSLGGISIQEPLSGGAYGPSKAALNWLTRALHIEHGVSGLIAVALHPGWAQTDMGHQTAGLWNIGPAPVTVEESVTGMVRVIDEASKEKYAGQFVTEQGKILSW
ncbi:Short-chain dehydrogenase RED3 [Cladobotryum mycophilum]|uniref:Short-chain dehydrogenase RED3 n=1 Tax=Cladobotryum mycophilum TaxID=491253 RepID=A0ABR0SJH0_9HYPO